MQIGNIPISHSYFEFKIRVIRQGLSFYNIDNCFRIIASNVFNVFAIS